MSLYSKKVIIVTGVFKAGFFNQPNSWHLIFDPAGGVISFSLYFYLRIVTQLMCNSLRDIFYILILLWAQVISLSKDILTDMR